MLKTNIQKKLGKYPVFTRILTGNISGIRKLPMLYTVAI